MRHGTRTFTEADWSNPDADIGAYTKSKTLAERAAWDFIEADGGTLELAVVNPVAIIGPVLGPKLSASIELVRRLLSGGCRGCPDLHRAGGRARRRRPAPARHARSGGRGRTVPGRRGPGAGHGADGAHPAHPAGRRRVRRCRPACCPNWLVRAAAVFVPALRELVPRLGVVRNASNAKAVGTLGWTPRPVEDSLVDTARSLQKLGML